MVEEQRARVDEAMTKMLEDVDKSFLRVLQGKMFKCAATCCDNNTSSVKSVQSCIETCGIPLEKAQNFLRSEVNHFQDRLQRCIMVCNDTIRDKMGTETSDSEIMKYTKEFEGCAKGCVDTHIALIPDILKKIKKVMKKENN